MSDWQRLFARPGGTVAAFATAQLPSDEGFIWAATAAGVFTSADAGRTWRRHTQGDDVPFAEAIAVSRDRILYAGGRGGLYRSEPGSRGWQRILAGARVLSLACAGNVLLVGTEQDGVLRSDDGGRTFGGANAGLLDLSVLAVETSADFEHDGTAFLASSSGLYRTRNAGKSWRPLDVDRAVECLSVSPTLVLAGTESEGLLRSDDAGAHWTQVSEFPGTSITAIARSSRSGVIAAATDLGVAVLEPGTRPSWHITSANPGTVLALTFATDATGEVLLAGMHRDGVARSAPRFDRWTLSNAGLQARLLLDLDLSPAFDSDHSMYAAGPDDGVLLSGDAGQTWTARLTGADDPAVSSVAASSNLLFAASDAGLLRSHDAGASWSVIRDDTPIAALHVSQRGVVVALAHGRLLESDDNGETWRSLGPDFDSDIISLARAPDGTLFVGTHVKGELTLWRCRDTGAGRQRWLVQRGGGDVLPIAISPTYALDETVYVGVGTRVLSPIRGTRESRSGEQRPMWRAVELGATVTALAAQRTVVYAATSSGVFVSRDSDATLFSRWTEPGGPQACVGIAVSPNGAVYAVELGGAVWRLTRSP